MELYDELFSIFFIDTSFAIHNKLQVLILILENPGNTTANLHL